MIAVAQSQDCAAQNPAYRLARFFSNSFGVCCPLRMDTLGPHQLNLRNQKSLLHRATLRDEIRQPDQQPLRLTIPTEERLARVADALLDDVGDDRTLDAWAQVAGMARRTFIRVFSAQAGMSFGRWRQQARLFAALELLAQRKSVTEVSMAVGYDSVSAFIEMFRTMLGTTPQMYLRGRQE